MLSRNLRRNLLNANKLFATALNATTELSNGQFQTLKAQTRQSKLRKGDKMPRHWEAVYSETQQQQQQQQQQQNSGKQQQQCYNLLSYNILAQDLLIEHMFLYVDIDPQLLRWEHRLRMLNAEITAIGPDILCLQEMQYNHLKHLVRLIGGGRKLEYVYKKKTGHRTDGCAIIYDRQKFRLLEERPLEFHVDGQAALNRDNIALMAKFCPRNEPAKQFIVATTHLLYNPKRSDVRAAQAQMLLNALNAFSARAGTQRRLPVLLTGDFNCVQHSLPHQVLLTATNKLPATPASYLAVPSESAPQQPQAVNYVKEPSLQMVPLNFGRNTGSTYQREWLTVDYILHSVSWRRDPITVWSVYKLPTVQECHAAGKIPNRYYGSDHYSLAVIFSV